MGNPPERRLDLLENNTSKALESIGNLFGVGGFWQQVSIKTTYTARPWDVVLCNPSAGGFYVGLPDPKASIGAQILVKNDSDSSNTITVAPRVGKIDGASQRTITSARASLWLLSTGLEWKVIESTTATSGGYTVQDGTDADTTALSNVLLRMPTVTAARTVTLPASPTSGTFVKLVVDNASAFAITASGNGRSIDDGFMAPASTYVIANQGAFYEFVYLATPNVWRIL